MQYEARRSPSCLGRRLARRQIHGRELQLQKAQLVDGAVLTKNAASQTDALDLPRSHPAKPWPIPEGAQTPAVWESVKMKARVLSFAPSASLTWPRLGHVTTRPCDDIIRITDCFASSCCRLSSGSCPSGSRLMSAMIAHCPARVSALISAFTVTATTCRSHILSELLKSPATTAPDIVCDMINNILRFWVHERIRFVLNIRPTVPPPPRPDTVFDMPPLTAFHRSSAACQAGGTISSIIG